MWISKIFSSTLTTIWKIVADKAREKQSTPRVEMPASTKIISAREIDKKLRDFDTGLSLFNTGTDAYLRQDDSLMSPRFPSSIVINTAGPAKLRATEAGLLNLLVKDDKGNLHFANHA